MLNVGLVGFGLSGRYLQAPFFVVNPHFNLKYVVTQNQNPTEIFPTVKKVSTIDAVLDDPTIDLVSIATPSLTHFDLAMKCLNAGKHILVEKPFTATVKEAETIREMAERVGKHVFVFQNRRFDSDFKTVQKIIKSGVLGDILTYEAHYNRFKPILNPKKWKEIVSPANGILYDLGAHIIDQTLLLFGKPQGVWGEAFTQREGSEIDDAFHIHLNYGRLKVLLRSSLMVREDTPRYIIHGTRGSFIKYGIDVQEDHLKLGWMPDDPRFGIEPIENQGILNTEINDFTVKGKVETEGGNWMPLFENMYDVIQNGAKPFVHLDQIIEQLRIMEACKKV